MPDYDHSYKLLFSHAEMIRDLLRDVLPEVWASDIDLDTLEKLPASAVADDLQERHDDMIWRLRFRGQWLYLYFILEFRSTIDSFMAVRFEVYEGLLYQDLIRREEVTLATGLPIVVPVVVYHGERAWTAALDIADLIPYAPAGLEKYRPHLRDLVIDENRLSDEELRPLRNVAACLFRLEKNRSAAEIKETLALLLEMLRGPERDSLARAFAVWMTEVLLPSRMPGTEIPHLQDLREVQIMLEENTIDWTRSWKEQGLQEGRREGRAEGRREGEAALLLRLLQRKFGVTTAEVQQRVSEADADTLLEWGDRVLTANRLEEVFDRA